MQRQKRDLAILLVLQFSASIIGSVLLHETSRFPRTIALGMMFVDLILLQYLLYRVTASYARTRAFSIFYAALVVAQFVMNGFVNVDIPVSETYTLSSITYPTSLVVFSIIFYFIVQDMFANKHETTYSLLAASNAYFLIGQIFGMLYAIVALPDPSILGAEVVTGNDLVQRTFEIGFYVLAGLDLPEGVGPMLKNLAVVEAILANLYIIFVVGRLMSNQK